MSARGWADTLTRAADVAELEAKHYDAKRTAEYREAAAVARADAAALRQLAAPLEKITPEHVQRARWRAEHHAKHAREWRENTTSPRDFTEKAAAEREADARLWTELADILAALHRGPPEQQETGR